MDGHRLGMRSTRQHTNEVAVGDRSDRKGAWAFSSTSAMPGDGVASDAALDSVRLIRAWPNAIIGVARHTRSWTVRGERRYGRVRPFASSTHLVVADDVEPAPNSGRWCGPDFTTWRGSSSGKLIGRCSGAATLDVFGSPQPCDLSPCARPSRPAVRGGTATFVPVERRGEARLRPAPLDPRPGRATPSASSWAPAHRWSRHRPRAPSTAWMVNPAG